MASPEAQKGNSQKRSRIKYQSVKGSKGQSKKFEGPVLT